ncbi:tRNA (guanine(37)-N1)-methyltransferase 1-like [Salvia splendens]|uniref:tRNA (guanine(37)-N1)-methyltransferase 1-like n=1 Tax=Salvia splendens TaxID=180675 RepID=UPI001C25DAF6|nr:tRNA (guanine(37)-N1)-methyltransferase 1-like [Salvia splendens]
MATKLSLFRPITLFPPPHFAAKPRFIAALSCSGNSPLSFSYGPSLHKGHSPLPLDSPIPPSPSLDEAAFTRVFDISALRVPSAICSTLENRLRGHLLNWSRVRNIARVPGDEIRSILPQSDELEDESLVALNRMLYGMAEGDGE